MPTFDRTRDMRGIGWVPVRTAAKLLSCSRQRVHQLIQEGKLVAREMDGTVLVNQQSIEARAALLQRRLFDG